MEDDFKPTVQHQRRVNPKIHEVIKKEVIKLLDVGLIYPISDSPWVSPVHYVPKKGGMTVVENEGNELIPTRLVTGWRVCIDYRKLNDATRKDHFSLPFMDQMLERLSGNEYYCFLDGFFRYFQISIDPQDKEKTTFTCPYGMFAYQRMPFGLCRRQCHNVDLTEREKFIQKTGRNMDFKEKRPVSLDKSKIEWYNCTQGHFLGHHSWNESSEKSYGKTNEANTQKPKTVYESVNRDKVIIEDWNSDDEDRMCPKCNSCPVKTNETQTVKTRVDKIDQTS
ncbi:hypothetical protein Tco_0105371 [Tanacetum coccineum]